MAVFTRDKLDGYLELEAIYWDGVDGVDGISYPTAFAMSPDSRFLYVAGSGDDALAVFSMPDTWTIFHDGFESGDSTGWSQVVP